MILSVSIAIFRDKAMAAIWLGLIGLVLFVFALVILRNAHRIRIQLKQKLDQLRSPKRSGQTGIVLFLLISIVSSVAADDSLVTTTLKLQGNVSAEIGSIEAPSRRDRETDRQIKIAFIRVKCADPSAPPTFVLAGGPSDSGRTGVRRILWRRRTGVLVQRELDSE